MPGTCGRTQKQKATVHQLWMLMARGVLVKIKPVDLEIQLATDLEERFAQRSVFKARRQARYRPIRAWSDANHDIQSGNFWR